jgi:hypothetical protein
MESCVQSQGEEEEIELINLPPPQPQRPFSSLRLLLRSTPAFLLLVIILLLILNSQRKEIIHCYHISCARPTLPVSHLFIQKGKMGGEGARVWRVCTQTHTTTPSLHQRILHRTSRILQIETGDRDLQMHNYLCNRARMFGDDPMQKNRGNFWCERREECERYACSLLSPSSSLFFRFLAPPHRTGACQVRPEATPRPGSVRSCTPGSGSSGPVVRDEAVPRLQPPVVQKRYLQEYSQSVSNTFFFFFFFFGGFLANF